MENLQQKIVLVLWRKLSHGYVKIDLEVMVIIVLKLVIIGIIHTEMQL
jgi:hypothetical protein